MNKLFVKSLIVSTMALSGFAYASFAGPVSVENQSVKHPCPESDSKHPCPKPSKTPKPEKTPKASVEVSDRHPCPESDSKHPCPKPTKTPKN